VSVWAFKELVQGLCGWGRRRAWLAEVLTEAEPQGILNESALLLILIWNSTVQLPLCFSEISTTKLRISVLLVTVYLRMPNRSHANLTWVRVKQFRALERSSQNNHKVGAWNLEPTIKTCLKLWLYSPCKSTLPVLLWGFQKYYTVKWTSSKLLWSTVIAALKMRNKFNVQHFNVHTNIAMSTSPFSIEYLHCEMHLVPSILHDSTHITSGNQWCSDGKFRK